MTFGLSSQNYFGLTRDPLFWSVRSKQLKDPLHLPQELGCFLRVAYKNRLGRSHHLMSWASFESTPLYRPHHLQPSDIALIADTLKNTPRWDVLHWSRVSSTQAELIQTEFEARGMSVISHSQSIFGIDLSGGVESAWMRLSKKYRAAYKNAVSRLNRSHGDVVSKLCMSDIQHVYSKRHERMGEGDYSVNPEFLTYLAELRTVFMQEDRWVECGVRINQQVIAFACGFRVPQPESKPDLLFVYQIGFDPEFSKLSPGRQAVWTLVENEFKKKPFQLVDFMSEGEHFRVIAPDPHQYTLFKIFAPTLQGKALYIHNRMSDAKKKIFSPTSTENKEADPTE